MKDKENYFAALRQADAGLLEPFIEYIAKNLNRSLEIMIKGAKVESVEDPDDLEKEIALLERKLKSAGETVAVTKSKESILGIYDDSISRLATKFIEKGELFKKFYVENQFKVCVDGVSDTFSRLVKFTMGRDLISKRTNDIEMYYRYQAFMQQGFPEFNYESKIAFKFNTTRYRVKNSDGLTFQKLYSEQLTDEEIQELVKAETRRHKQTIENKIEEAKKKK